MGRIKSIETLHDIEITQKPYSLYSGYLINLDNDRGCFVLIESGQFSYENSGYVISTDEPDDFIGAELLNVTLTSKALNTKQMMQELEDNEIVESEAVFVNFETSAGLFQIAVYNSHDGYYGHDVVIVYDDKVLFDDLL